LAFPEAVTVNRFFIPLCVFCFGIVEQYLCDDRSGTFGRIHSSGYRMKNEDYSGRRL